MSEKIICGIDLGTSTSCIGIVRNKVVEFINDQSGKAIIPSYVYYKENNEILVGESAKNAVVKDTKRVIYDVKRLIGMNYDKANNDIKLMRYSVINKDNNIIINISEKEQYTPIEVSTEILKSLKYNLEQELEEKYSELDKYTVITVPASFNNAQKDATKRAAENAGFKVLQLLNEPTAAAIAYGLTSNIVKEKHKIFVFDLGGGTFDVSIIEITDRGDINVIGTDGDPHLGGEDFTNSILDYFKQQYKEKTNTELSIKQEARLKKLCDDAKCMLSECIDTYVNSSVLEDAGISVVLTRSTFDELNKPLFNKTIDVTKRLLTNLGMSQDDITEIVLVGGSSRIVKIRELLRETFPKTLICSDINPDEAVAMGATIYAKQLTREREEEYNRQNIPKLQKATPSYFKPKVTNPDSKSVEAPENNINIKDVSSYSIGMEYTDDFDVPGLMWTFIKKNSPLPYKHVETFETTENNQKYLELKIYEGEDNFTRNNELIGKLTVDNLPLLPAGRVGVEITFELDKSGLLQIKAINCENKQEFTTTIDTKH